jgi:hypothetical protein
MSGNRSAGRMVCRDAQIAQKQEDNDQIKAGKYPYYTEKDGGKKGTGHQVIFKAIPVRQDPEDGRKEAVSQYGGRGQKAYLKQGKTEFYSQVRYKPDISALVDICDKMAPG